MGGGAPPRGVQGGEAPRRGVKGAWPPSSKPPNARTKYVCGLCKAVIARGHERNCAAVLLRTSAVRIRAKVNFMGFFPVCCCISRLMPVAARHSCSTPSQAPSSLFEVVASAPPVSTDHPGVEPVHSDLFFLLKTGACTLRDLNPRFFRSPTSR